MSEISDTLRGSFTKFFGTVRQKIFDGNLWYPLLCEKFFGIPNFLRHWRDAHEVFRHCETENFRRKILILLPPFLSINFFAIRNFLKHSTEGFPYEILQHCETKNFRRKILISPPLLSINFFATGHFLKHRSEGFLYDFFSPLWDIKISTENRDKPRHIHKVFRYQKISRKQKGSFKKLFVSILWDKKFQQNRDAISPMHKNIR